MSLPLSVQNMDDISLTQVENVFNFHVILICCIQINILNNRNRFVHIYLYAYVTVLHKISNK